MPVSVIPRDSRTNFKSMKPDLKNEPLTVEEFLKLPEKLIAGEYWEPISEGVSHKEYSGRDGWGETLITIFSDDCIKIIGFLGKKTGIRLCHDCSEVLEGNAKSH